MPARRTKVASEGPSSLAIPNAAVAGEDAFRLRRGRDPIADGYEVGTDAYAAWLEAYDHAKRNFDAAQARVSGDPAEWSDLLDAGVAQAVKPSIAGELLHLALELIDDDANPRKEFTDLDGLAESIKARGVLQPLMVEPKGAGRYRLLAGGRRIRAAKKAGLKTVPCYVRDLPPGERAIARLEENFQRVDLNAFEKAEAFRDALKPTEEGGTGLKQAELAKQLQISEGHLSNTMRLLELPEVWRPYVLEGNCTVTDVRDGILKFGYLGRDLLIAAEKFAKDEGRWRGLDEHALASCVQRAAGERARQIGWNCPIDPRTRKKHAKELKILKVGHNEYAFGVEAYDRLVAAVKEREQEREEQQRKKKPTAAEAKRLSEQKARQLRTKLYGYKVRWLQARLAVELEKLETGDAAGVDRRVLRILAYFAIHGGRSMGVADLVRSVGGKTAADFEYLRGGDIAAALVSVGAVEQLVFELVRHWTQGSIQGYQPTVHPEAIEAFAANFGIRFAQDWTCDREFLELHNRGQLETLCEEWKLEPPDCKKVSELVDWIEQRAGKKKCPSSLKDVEPCHLV